MHKFIWNIIIGMSILGIGEAKAGLCHQQALAYTELSKNPNPEPQVLKDSAENVYNCFIANSLVPLTVQKTAIASTMETKYWGGTIKLGTTNPLWSCAERGDCEQFVRIDTTNPAFHELESLLVSKNLILSQSNQYLLLPKEDADMLFSDTVKVWEGAASDQSIYWNNNLPLVGIQSLGAAE